MFACCFAYENSLIDAAAFQFQVSGVLILIIAATWPFPDTFPILVITYPDRPLISHEVKPQFLSAVLALPLEQAWLRLFIPALPHSSGTQKSFIWWEYLM